MKQWHQASFVLSVSDTKKLPVIRSSKGMLLPEIALAGRSNCGKSSLINSLFASKLAKTSATPGKTQLLNFFRYLDYFSVCDLPGYGYAKVPTAIKDYWGKLIDGYLHHRKELSLLILIVDIRRGLEDEELELINWCTYYNKKCLLVLSKCDKVSTQEKKKCYENITKDISNKNINVVYYSAKTNEGKEELRSMIWNVLIDKNLSASIANLQD